MFFTNSIRASEIGQGRMLGHEDIIPSININIIIPETNEETNIIFIVPNYSNRDVRIVLDLIDGARLNNKSLDYLDASLQIVYGNIIIDDEYNNVRSVQKKLFEDIRLTDYEEAIDRLIISQKHINKITDFFNERGCHVCIGVTNEQLEELDLDLLVKGNVKFIYAMSVMSRKEDYCDIVGSRIIYPEDIYNNDYLTLENFNKYNNHAMNTYTTIKQEMLSSEYTDEQKDLVKVRYCSCGGEIVVNKTNIGVTSLECVNPYCKVTMSWSMSELVKSIGVLGMGGKTLLPYVNIIWRNSVYAYGESEIRYSDILGKDLLDLLDGATYDKWLEFREVLSEYNGYLDELVVMSGLPRIGKNASTVVTKELIETADSQLDFFFVCSKTPDSKVKSLNVAIGLFNYLDDLQSLVRFSKVQDVNKLLKYKVCITYGVKFPDKDGNILTPTKENFIRYVNDMIQEFPNAGVTIELQQRVTRETDLLINDSGQHSSNNNTAELYGVPVGTSKGFVQTILGVIEDGKRDK